MVLNKETKPNQTKTQKLYFLTILHPHWFITDII